MKYTILINQKAVVASGLSLDVIDLCVFSFVSDFIASGNAKKKIEGDHVFYLIGWKLVSKQLPVVGLTTRQSVYNRIKKLCDQDVLCAHESNQVLGQSWYRQGKNMTKLLFSEPVNDDLQGCNESFAPPVNDGLHNKTIIDNTISNKGPGNPATQKPLEKTMTQRKIDFLKLLVDYATENPGKYPKLLYVDFAKYWVEQSVKSRKPKLRFEDQQYFDVGRRLSTWFQKSDEQQLQKYWESENKIGTINELFKRQILNLQ